MNFSAQKYASHATAVVIDDVIIIDDFFIDALLQFASVTMY